MLYVPVEDKTLSWKDRFDKNWALLKKCDSEAAAKGQLIGRYITEPFADGQAVYQIIKENKLTVRIRVCTGLGDDWVIPYWGGETTIKKEYALQKIKQREAIARLFSKKNS